MMRLAAPLGGLAVAIALASPAVAAWETIAEGDQFGLLARADEDQNRAFAIGCKRGLPDVFTVNIYLGAHDDPESISSAEVGVRIMTDGRQLPIANGVLRNFRGNLVLDTATSLDATWHQVLAAMAESTSTINVQFDQFQYRFSPDGLAEGMRFLHEKCQ